MSDEKDSESLARQDDSIMRSTAVRRAAEALDKAGLDAVRIPSRVMARLAFDASGVWDEIRLLTDELHASGEHLVRLNARIEELERDLADARAERVWAIEARDNWRTQSDEVLADNKRLRQRIEELEIALDMSDNVYARLRAENERLREAPIHGKAPTPVSSQETAE